jgi:hypothetical protein
MSTIVPHSEQLKSALRWISSEREANPKAPLLKLVSDAALRFDLSPAEEEWLLNTFKTGPR